MTAPLVIAEAGVNHNGDEKLAIELVRAAKCAGADIVKFQHFRSETIVARGTSTADYQARNSGASDQSALLGGLELDIAAFARIAKVCREEGILFLCTAFDMEAASDLVALGMPYVKIPSGELTNIPMLRAYAAFGLPVLLSTGMGSLDEVATALDTLSGAGARDVTLLQCTSLYPAPASSLNLRAMLTMHDRFGLPVGFSDHSLDDYAAIAAVTLGASVIEKHLTLDRDMQGPDHRASLDPRAFAQMVARLRDTAAALGDGIKRPADGEEAIARLVRRSWHTTRALSAGAILAAADVTLKRPATGLRPADNPAGRRLRRALVADAPVTADALEG